MNRFTLLKPIQAFEKTNPKGARDHGLRGGKKAVDKQVKSRYNRVRKVG